MKNILFLFFISFASSLLWSQDLLPIRQNYQWGFIDTLGNVVIPPAYESVGQFNEYGYAVVRKNHKTGIINKENKVILPCEYQNLRMMDSSHILISQGKLWGVLNVVSLASTPAEYEFAKVLYSDDSTSYYAVRQNRLWGLVREKGQELLASKYESINYHQATETFIATTPKQKHGIVDKQGTKLLPIFHDSLKILPPHVLAYAHGEEGGVAIYNINKRKGTHYDYHSVNWCKDNRFLIVNEPSNGFNVLNPDNYEKLFLRDYENIFPTTDDHFVLKKNEEYGLGDGKGNVLIKPKYDTLYPSILLKKPNGYWVTFLDMLGWVNQEGKEVIPPKYKKIARLTQQYFITMNDEERVQIFAKDGSFATSRTFTDVLVGDHNIKLYHEEGVLVLSLDDDGKIIDQTELKQVKTIRVKGNMNNFNWNTLPRRNIPTRVVRNQQTEEEVEEEEVQRVKIYDNPFESVERGGAFGVNFREDSTHSRVLFNPQFSVLEIDDFYYQNVTVAKTINRVCLLIRDGNGLSSVYNFMVSVGYNEVEELPIMFVGKFSEDGLARIQLGKRKKYWGYINTEGEMVIPPVYTKARDFHDGKAMVCKESITKDGYSTLKSKKWGVIDTEGGEVIPIRYSEIKRVEVDENTHVYHVYSFKKLKGLVNKYGQEVSDVSYTRLGVESEGMTPVRKGKYWGYVDSLGNEYVDLDIQRAGEFGEGLAPVRIKNSWGYIDRNQDTVISFGYKRAEKFAHGLAPVKSKFGYYYIDKSGNPAFSKRFRKALPYQENGLAYAKKRTKYRIIDKEGKTISSNRMYKVNPYNKLDVATARKSRLQRKYILVNNKGEEISKRKYSKIYDFSEDSVAIVTWKKKGIQFNRGNKLIKIKWGNRKFGIIDIYGNEILNPKDNDTTIIVTKRSKNIVTGNLETKNKKVKISKFQKIKPFVKGRAWARTRIKASNGSMVYRWGVIDKKLNWVIEPIYFKVRDADDGYGIAYYSDSLTWHLVNFDNLEIKNIGQYKNLDYANGFIRVKEVFKVGNTIRKRYFFLSKEGEKAFYTGNDSILYFKEAQLFRGNCAVVKTENGYGMINITGNLVLPDYYTKIQYYRGAYKVSSSTFVGIMDENGLEILPPKYEQIKQLTPTILQVRQGGKIGYLYKDGVWFWKPRR
ncbi:MAG: WG repeat-containing protein [Cytophagales bacterium]|nr:WG repeat-containing protein [Cytophagales bacterium]